MSKSSQPPGSTLSTSTVKPRPPRLVVPRSIARHERVDAIDLEIVRTAWEKGIFANLPAKGVANCWLLKAYTTSKRGPRRIIFLARNASSDVALLLYRDKEDPIGANMSYQNEAFKTAIPKAVANFTRDATANQVDFYFHRDDELDD